MKSLFKKIFFIFVSFFLLYSVLWYYLTNSLEKNLNESKKYFFGKNSEMGFTEVSKSGFPFKLGLRIDGLFESYEDSSVVVESSVDNVVRIKGSYKDPLYLGYDILKQQFYLSYKGSVTSISSDENYQYNISVNSALSLEYSFYEFIKLLFKLDKDQNILSKLHKIQLEINDLKINDLKTDKKLASVKDFSFEIIKPCKGTRDNYTDLYFLYKSDGQIYTENNIYFLTHPYDLVLSNYKKDIILGLSIPKDIDNSKLNLIEMLSGSDIEIKKFHTVGKFDESNFIFRLSSPKNLFSKENFILHYNSDIKTKPGFLTYIADKILRLNTNFRLITISNDFNNSVKNLFSQINDPESINYDADLAFSLNPFSLAIKEFHIGIDDVKLDIKGDYFSNPVNELSEFIININEYNKIVDFVINKYSKYFKGDVEYLSQNPEIYNNSIIGLLNFISEPHDNNSKNLHFKLSFNGKNIRVGSYNLDQITQYFYQLTFNEALKHVENKGRYKEEILKIMPFLKNQPELLDNLIKNANIPNKTTE